MTFRIGCLALFLGSCGAAGAQAEPPVTESESPKTARSQHIATKTAEEAPKPAGSESETAPASPAPGADSAPEPASTSEPTKRPSEILGAPMVAFILDYQGSTPYESAEKNCDAEAK